MLERPLVPLDAWTVSEEALPMAAMLARKLEQQLVLLSVIPDIAGAEGLRSGAVEPDAVLAFNEQRLSYARDYLSRVQARLGEQGVESTLQTASGAPAARIVEAAAAQGSGLIVIATHARSTVARWFMGSVADRVVRTATVPTLLVRPQETGPPPAAIDHLVLSLDGSPMAEEALPVAAYLAATMRLPITLVRTVDLARLDPRGVAPAIVDALNAMANDYLQGVADRLRESGLEVRESFSFADPVDGIEEAGRSAPNPLIVISTHGRSGLTRTILGSVTDRVIRSSTAPVLVVPRETGGH